MKHTITFYYRGHVESGKNYRWTNGYSENGENGGVCYPWMTRRECQIYAKNNGLKAVFKYESNAV